MPSASLNIKVSAGSYVKRTDNTVGTYAGSSSTAMSASTTTYLWLNESGTLTTGASFPATGLYIPLAKVVSGSSTITSVTDLRIAAFSVGPGPKIASANQVAITDGSGGTPGTSVATITDTNTANAIASILRLLNELRSDLVTANIIKGSA